MDKVIASHFRSLKTFRKFFSISNLEIDISFFATDPQQLGFCGERVFANSISLGNFTQYSGIFINGREEGIHIRKNSFIERNFQTFENGKENSFSISFIFIAGIKFLIEKKENNSEFIIDTGIKGGDVILSIITKNGTHGIQIIYENQKIKKIKTYHQGVLSGFAKLYEKDGLSQGFFKNGKAVGRWHFYEGETLVHVEDYSPRQGFFSRFFSF